MDATKTTGPGGLLARLVSLLIGAGAVLLTVYVFLIYFGQGNVARLFQGVLPAVSGPAAKPAEGAYTVVGRDILYEQTQLEGPAGKPLTFTFRNAGSLQHSFVLKLPSGDVGVPESWNSGVGINGGQSANLNVPALAAGAYDYYCNVPGHSASMRGVLTIK